MPPAVNVAVLGSTGSIGRSALEVIAASEGRLKARMLCARSNTGLLLEQAKKFRPRWLFIGDETAAERQDWGGLPEGTDLVFGQDGLESVLLADKEINTVLAARG